MSMGAAPLGAEAFDVLDDVTEYLQMVTADLAPASMSGADAAVGVALFRTIANLASAGMALCAARVADSGHWRLSGDRTPAHWLARSTGCSMGEALAATQVPERLRHLPSADADVRAGGLSLAQAQLVTEAAVADPRAEEALLETAHREPLTLLREHANRVVASADVDSEARHRRVRSGRHLRHWTTSDGAFRFSGSTTPDQGAELLAAMAPVAKRLRRKARRAGSFLGQEAAQVDALIELCRQKDLGHSGTGPRRRPVVINVTVDRSAWERGQTQSGERCEIEGAGPVPVSVAQALAEDGEVNFIQTEGGEVVSLVSRSRHIPANVRRAVIARDPMCVVPGCYRRNDLEFHHWREDFAKSGRTSLADLCRVCEWHHRFVTRGEAHLLGGPGRWQYVLDYFYRQMKSGTDPPVAV
jgi:hypothetical protein